MPCIWIICMHMHAFAIVYVFTCMHMYANAYMLLYTYMYKNTYVCICMHMYATVCIYLRVDHHLQAPTSTGRGGILKMGTIPWGAGGVPKGPDAYIYI